MKRIAIAIVAMGGEGGGVLADWIVELAESSGFLAQETSVPGVAQRTGSTIYYVELFPGSHGREPVLALMPVPGEVDIVIASELMEAARAVERGLVTRDRTTLIASTHRVYSMTEKTALGDGRADPAKMLAACEATSKVFVRADFARIAEERGSVISAALFGALASSGGLPFSRGQFETAIRASGVGVESSLAAFAAGYDARPEQAPSKSEVRLGPRLDAIGMRIEQQFPGPSHPVLRAAVQRLADYQDERYAAEFLDRLTPFRDPELIEEVARQLALWMSYEDTIRVADLKIRAARTGRVRKEVRAADAQMVEIEEFLHPGIEEIADTMPAALGRWLIRTRWARGMAERFTREGRVVRSTSLRGFLLLYSIAGLRRFRRKTLRFVEEQARMEAWLARVAAISDEDRELAREVAACAALIRGYGETRRRGRARFDALVDAAGRIPGSANRAASLRRLREAALSEESGAGFDSILHELTR